MNWRNIYKGIAMGIVETVPGVSSSTIAMLLGIYEQIIVSISNLTTKKYKKAVLYLIPIGIGIIFGAGFSVVSIKYLLDFYPVSTSYLFMGLIIGMLPFMWRRGQAFQVEKNTYTFFHFLIMVISFLLVASFSFVVDIDESVIMNLTMTDYLFLFFAGWLASIALVLPGMSGALILMVVGAYYTALNALLTFDLPVIFTIIAGLIIGILMTGKIVRFLLNKYYQSTYASIIGLLGGSLIVLYPGLPNQITELILSVLFFTIGFYFSLFISKK